MLFRKKSDPANRIVIVSGLPRSGTSLMMMMLDAAGIPPMQDHIRSADDDNPKGYYEYERVKAMPEGDIDWVKDAPGKSVKVITALLKHLPDRYSYDMIVMRREMAEILASQKKMLVRRGEDPDKVSDQEMADLFSKHFSQVMSWVRQQKNIRYIEVSYNEILAEPEAEIEKVNQFLGGNLDTAAMLAKIDPALYRQRK
ncbi:MAG: sulfotransferase [Anaerolineales bacterium]|nr:sulfotransferase [Anaerolineales bacterium]